MESEEIRTALRAYRRYEGEAIILEKCLDGNGDRSIYKDRLCGRRKQLVLMDGWLRALPEEEAFIVRLHLVDGLDWAHVAVEYANRWGQELARSIQTLKRKQATALHRIEESVSMWSEAQDVFRQD
jgi:hypothetical protein